MVFVSPWGRIYLRNKRNPGYCSICNVILVCLVIFGITVSLVTLNIAIKLDSSSRIFFDWDPFQRIPWWLFLIPTWLSLVFLTCIASLAIGFYLLVSRQSRLNWTAALSSVPITFSLFIGLGVLSAKLDSDHTDNFFSGTPFLLVSACLVLWELTWLSLVLIIGGRYVFETWETNPRVHSTFLTRRQ